MARNHKKHRGGNKMTLPLAVVGGFMPTVTGVWNNRSSVTAVGDYLKGAYVGLDSSNNFNPSLMRGGLMPAAVGFIVHMIAGRLGINRAIARAGVPFIRV